MKLQGGLQGWEGTRKFFLAGMPEVLRLVVLEYNIRPSMRSALRSYVSCYASLFH